MEHTPYGYKIVNGKAVIDEDKAAVLRKICDNYLSGMSYVAAAADAGITMKHCGVKRLLQNKKYLGDDFQKDKKERKRSAGTDEKVKRSRSRQSTQSSSCRECQRNTTMQ